MLDLVEREVEGCKFCERFEPFDVRDEVVIKVDFGQRCGGVGGDVDRLYAVLA